MNKWVLQISKHCLETFSTYSTFSEKLTFLTPWYAHIRTYEHFAYVLNEWSHSIMRVRVHCYFNFLWLVLSFKRQHHKMAKHTLWMCLTNLWGWWLKGLRVTLLIKKSSENMGYSHQANHFQFWLMIFRII